MNRDGGGGSAGGHQGTGYLSDPENRGGANRPYSGYNSGPEFRPHNRYGSGSGPGFMNYAYNGPGYGGYSQESGIGRSNESSGIRGLEQQNFRHSMDVAYLRSMDAQQQLRSMDAQQQQQHLRNMDAAYMRNLDAQRAAECLLSTSAGSSANSQQSLPDQMYQNGPPSGFVPSYGSNAAGGFSSDPSGRAPHPYMQQGMRYQPQPYFSHLQHRTVYNGGQPYPVVMTDDLVSGTRPNGRMSPVRRTFLLLCTFDVVFLSFLWLIAILVTGNDLRLEFYAQIIKYTIHSSMFDCILVSLMRFTMCMIFYALMDISHWWVVVFTTVGTVGFLVPKVFEYSWHHDPITYDVSLVLLSFIIAWSEAWFFDFRMVPLESKAKEIWEGHGYGEDNERAPLIPPAEGGMLQRYIEGSTLYEGSVANFYSPMESLENSSDEEEEGQIHEDTGIRIPRRFKRRKNKALSEQEKQFKKLGEQMLQDAWSNLSSNEGWKIEKCLDNGDTVQVKTINKKKIFRLTGYIDISCTSLLEELYYRIEGIPLWNRNITDSKIIQPIDEYTDVTYQVCAEAAGGVVSTRDFVNLRHWCIIDGTFVSAACSVEHPAMPVQHKKVRGENGPTCYALYPVEGSPDKCLFKWLLDTDLKGWIPQSIIDKALSGAQLEFLQFLRQRAIHLLSSEDNASSIGSCVDPVNIEQ